MRIKPEKETCDFCNRQKYKTLLKFIDIRKYTTGWSFYLWPILIRFNNQNIYKEISLSLTWGLRKENLTGGKVIL